MSERKPIMVEYRLASIVGGEKTHEIVTKPVTQQNKTAFLKSIADGPAHD